MESMHKLDRFLAFRNNTRLMAHSQLIIHDSLENNY